MSIDEYERQADGSFQDLMQACELTKLYMEWYCFLTCWRIKASPLTVHEYVAQSAEQEAA